jgi:hypothetical protein
MINKAVHYNKWATFHPEEFACVATAFKTLLKSMQCSNAPCSAFLYVSPPKGELEALRCPCGRHNYNLKKK